MTNSTPGYCKTCAEDLGAVSLRICITYTGKCTVCEKITKVAEPHNYVWPRDIERIDSNG